MRICEYLILRQSQFGVMILCYEYDPLVSMNWQLRMNANLNINVNRNRNKNKRNKEKKRQSKIEPQKKM